MFSLTIWSPGLLSLAAGYKKEEFGQWAAVMRAYWGFINGTGRELKHEGKHTQLITPWLSCTVHTATQSVCVCVRAWRIYCIYMSYLFVWEGREQLQAKVLRDQNCHEVFRLKTRPTQHLQTSQQCLFKKKKKGWFELIISLTKDNLFRAFVFLLCYIFAINIWYQWEHHPH